MSPLCRCHGGRCRTIALCRAVAAVAAADLWTGCGAFSLDSKGRTDGVDGSLAGNVGHQDHREVAADKTQFRDRPCRGACGCDQVGEQGQGSSKKFLVLRERE